MKITVIGNVAVVLLLILFYEHAAKINKWPRVAPMIESSASMAREFFAWVGVKVALASSWVIYLRLDSLLGTLWDLLDPLFRLLLSFFGLFDGYAMESLRQSSPLGILIGSLLSFAVLNKLWMHTTGRPALLTILIANLIRLFRLLERVILGESSERKRQTRVVHKSEEESSSSVEEETVNSDSDEGGSSEEEMRPVKVTGSRDPDLMPTRVETLRTRRVVKKSG